MTDAHEEGVMSTADRLIYMANQIARNLAAEGGERASDMVADHIRSFWDPAPPVAQVQHGQSAQLWP